MNSKFVIAVGLALAVATGVLLLVGGNIGNAAQYVGTWSGESLGQWQFAALDLLSESGESMGSGLLEEEFTYGITVVLTPTALGGLTAAIEIGQEASDPLESMVPARVRVRKGMLTITFERHIEPFAGAAIHTTLELYLSLDGEALIGTGLYVADLELADQGAFEIHGEPFPNERMTIHWSSIELVREP